MNLLFFYAVGLGLPLIIVATLCGNLPKDGLFWTLLRGKGRDITVGGKIFFPHAIIILPQLGSSPAIAVLTKGELAIENATFFAMIVVLPPIIFIVINLLAPSPSATICFARFKHNLCKAFSKSCNLGSNTL